MIETLLRESTMSERTIERTVEFVTRIGKRAVLCKDRPGFIANRLSRPFMLTAQRLVEIVKYHHHPADAGGYLKEACVIARADALVYEMKIGNSGEPGVPALDQKVSEVIPIPDEEINQLQEEITVQVDDTVRMFF